MKKEGITKIITIMLSLTLIVGMVFVFSVCVSAAPKPINIGYTPPFSGVVAMMGPEEVPAVKLVLKEVNAAGGINGRPIKLFVYDSGGDPAKTVANLKRLKEKDHVVAALGPCTSTSNLAAKAWAERNHIPVITNSSMSDKLIHKKGKSWWFRTMGPTSEAVGAVLARINKLGYSKVAFEGTTLAWGPDTLNGVRKLCPQYGLKLVSHILCEPKSMDLTIQASQLRKSGAEAVIVTDYSAEQCTFARALNGIGWTPYVISVDENTTVDALTMCNTALFENWECKSQIDRTKPLLIEVWDKYEAFTGKRYEDEKVPRTFDIIWLVLEAIRLSGNPDDPEAIRDAFYKIKDFPVSEGKIETTASFEIGRNHMLTAKDMVIYKVRSGTLVKVD